MVQILHRPRTRAATSSFETSHEIPCPEGRHLCWTGLRPELPELGTWIEGPDSKKRKVVRFDSVPGCDDDDTVGVAWIMVVVHQPGRRIENLTPGDCRL